MPNKYEFEHPYADKLCLPYYAWAIFWISGTIVVIFLNTLSIGPLQRGSRDRGIAFWISRIILSTYVWLRIVFVLFSAILIWTTYSAWRTHDMKDKSSWKMYSGWVASMLYLPSQKFVGALLAVTIIAYDDSRNPFTQEDPVIMAGLVLNAIMDGVLFALYFGSSLAAFVPGFYIFAPQPFLCLFGVFVVWMAIWFVFKCLGVIWIVCCMPCRTVIFGGKDPKAGDFFEERHVDDTMNMGAIIFILYMTYWVSIVSFQNFISHVDWTLTFQKTMRADYCEYKDNYTVDWGNWKVEWLLFTWLVF